MLDGYYYCLNCHSEITPDYNEHCCFCGSAAVAVSGDYSPEEVETAFDLLNKQQQGLVFEVRHGEWIPIPEYENKRCSVCSAAFSDFTLGYYCPKCGAKMDGKEVANSG
jgi:Zn finger protein HypA/HybF involved in hydrogenase expression